MIFRDFTVAFRFAELFPHSDPGAVALRRIMEDPVVFSALDVTPIRSHTHFIASWCMQQVANFRQLDYSGFLASQPESALKLLFGLKLITSRAQPRGLTMTADHVTFYSMLDYRYRLYLHFKDPTAAKKPQPFVTRAARDDMSDARVDAPKLLRVPKTLQAVKKTADAARGAYRARLKKAREEAAASTAASSVPSVGRNAMGGPVVAYLVTRGRLGLRCVTLQSSRECF